MVWRKAMLSANVAIRDAIRNLDETGIKIILVINHAGVLEGTVSDGDIRRGLIKGFELHQSISKILNRNFLVVTPDISSELVMQLMTANKIQQIPVVNAQHQVVGLHLWDEITSPPSRSNQMVIMAGGLGKRLLPHTENCPKPLLPIAGKPILEHIIERAKLEGFNHFVFAVRHLGHMIEDHFASGERLGVKIDYLREDSPLGTAGALGLLSLPNEPFVVTNGDVMTDIRYGELLDFHIRHDAAATMAVRAHEWQNPFGVVQTEGIEIIGFEEKPIFRSYINAGIYVLDPGTLKFLQANQNCDMPTLFERLQENNLRTVAYPMHEPWLDVGRPDDLIQANKEN
jgi:dTDP-glucose pyrophosphorylase